MKNTFILATLLSTMTLSGIFISSSEAKEKKSKTQPQETSVVHYSQAEASSSNKNYSLQLGLSTITSAPNLRGATSIAAGGTSITALLELTHLDSLQAFISIPTTLTDFNLDVLGMYKRTILDDGSYGIHVGAGFGLGALQSNLIVTFMGVAGLHFEVPGAPHVKIHLDAGPSLTLINSTPSQTSFQIGALSPALGLSVLYAL